MIWLENLLCKLAGEPPKWTHLDLSEAFPFAASMIPVGGSPPPDVILDKEESE